VADQRTAVFELCKRLGLDPGEVERVAAVYVGMKTELAWERMIVAVLKKLRIHNAKAAGAEIASEFVNTEINEESMAAIIERINGLTRVSNR
jgi:hypothetical protein